MIIKRPIGEKGQVVIPKDIRNLLQLKREVVFEIQGDNVIIKPEKNPEEFLEEFFNIARTNEKDITLKDLKKIEDDSYDLP